MFATWGRVWPMHFYLLFPLYIIYQIYMKTESWEPSYLLPCTPPLFRNLLDSRAFCTKHLPAVVTFAGHHPPPLFSQASIMPDEVFEQSPILYWCICIVYIHHQCSSAYLFQHFLSPVLLPLLWVLCMTVKYEKPRWQEGGQREECTREPHTRGETLPK